jgi:DNA repair exonuclease SbcCD ATPase subunit
MATLEWLEITGFRSFAEMQRLDFSGDLALIWGPNSQGKTSIAEAIEFLLTGATIRRELLGGAKAEFGACLRNAHLADDAPVVVRAGIRDQDGELREVERTLTRDYGADADCDSALTIDGVPATDVSPLGLVLADPPLRAPVLLQHSLRFALSARPQDRSNYFKSVLEIQDLETLRDLIEGSAGSLQTATTSIVAKLRGLRTSKRLGHVANDVEGAELRVVPSKLSDAIDAALVEVGITPQKNEGLPSRAASLVAALERQREASFPSSAYAVANELPGPLDAAGLVAACAFNEAIAAVDLETDRVTRVFEAVLAVPTIVETSRALDCPVCESVGTLTPKRIAAIREQVAAT